MRNRNHPLFRNFDPEGESCVAFACRVNERYRLEQMSSKSTSATPELYRATDDDLPAIFFEGSAG